jgi:hypothetical protein
MLILAPRRLNQLIFLSWRAGNQVVAVSVPAAQRSIAGWPHRQLMVSFLVRNFAALHDSAIGPSHPFDPVQRFGRCRGEADMIRPAKPAGSVEKDPSRPFAAKLRCSAAREALGYTDL